jgi:LysM repeat protein
MPRRVVGLVSLVAIVASLGGRSMVANVEGTSEHVVKSGETLVSIAEARGVPFDRLLALNQLADPNALTVGQVIRLDAPAATGRVAASAPAASASVGPADHVVRAGDSLWTISRQAGVTVDALAQANGLTDVDRLAVGQRLVLPGNASRVAPRPDAPATTVRAASGAEHVVRPNETLWDIARQLGTTVEALASANGIADPNRLAVGQRLALPEGAGRAGARPTESRAPATPTAASPAAPLPERVVAAARSVAGPRARIGVAAYDLTGGRRLAIAANETFPAASVAKLAILTEAYRQGAAGQRPLTDATKADLGRMVAVSDNDAANRLIDRLGPRAINGGMSALGLGTTRVVNHFGAARPAGGGLNQTTPAEMARWLELLATDQLVSAPASREMRALLARTADGSKIGRGLPPGAGLAHKSGWYGGVANDVGIVTHGPSRYVLAVFTEGIPDGEIANQTVAAVTRTVHAAWGPR